MTNTYGSPGRRTFLTAAGATLATLGSRNASAQAVKPLSFQLSWIKSIQYGGYFAGLDIGSFKAAGVEATFVSGGPNMDPIANVAAGNSQLGDRPAGSLLLARDHDIPIRIIGAVFQKSPYSVISLASKPITTVKEMMGKTIATPTSGRPLMVYLLQAAGLDPASVNMVPASPDPAGLVAGQIDGYMGYSTNQGVMLQTRGVDIHVLNAQESGLPDAAGVIYGRQDFLQANRPLVVDFLRGAIKGWQWALSHPEEDAHLMVDKYGAQGLKYEAQHAEVVASKPYVEAGLASTQGLLALDMTLFGNMIEVYRKVGMISGKWELPDLCDPSFIDEAHSA
jgi:ABC-type nitrate/sulfonate/bicarbonate transport system substrate-binding protein